MKLNTTMARALLVGACVAVEQFSAAASPAPAREPTSVKPVRPLTAPSGATTPAVEAPRVETKPVTPPRDVMTPTAAATRAREAKGAAGVLNCGGTEPDWDVTISPEALTFQVLDESARSMANHGFQTGAGMPSAHTVMYQGITREPPRESMTVLVQEANGRCSDNMSDTDYQFSSAVIIGGKLWLGCCN